MQFPVKNGERKSVRGKESRERERVRGPNIYGWCTIDEGLVWYDAQRAQLSVDNEMLRFSLKKLSASK